jgi:DNA-binding NtrC family response regulator
MAVVLIVDDEQVVRQILSRCLQPTGHEIYEADSADTALQFLEKLPAAVVFSDIQMPGHDGIWLTTEIRKRYPATAVVLATAVSTIAPRFSMQAGVLAYLVKPFTQQAVLDGFAKALEWHSKADTAPAPKRQLDELQSWLDALPSR